MEVIDLVRIACGYTLIATPVVGLWFYIQYKNFYDKIDNAYGRSSIPRYYNGIIAAINTKGLHSYKQAPEREREFLDTYFSQFGDWYQGTVVNEKFDPPNYIVSMSPFIHAGDVRGKLIELAYKTNVRKEFNNACIFNDRVIIHYDRPVKISKGGIAYDY
jgi:hypothetical protein